MTRPTLRMLSALGFAACLAGVAPAQQGGRIPVRVVAGKLVVSCDVSSPSRRIPVNLFFEYESACGLQLHNRAAAPLRIETSDGRTIPLTLHFPDFEVVVARREHGDEELLEEFTKYHSAELGENAVVGVIGGEVFAAYHVTFDLAAGYVELGAPRERSGEPPPVIEGSTLVPITIHNAMAWLPVRYADGEPAALAIGTARYDTVIDVDVCEERDAPAGDLGALRVGDIDLSAFVALRPEEVVLVHPDGVAGVSGLNLLQHFRVEVDRENRFARLTPTAPADFPEEDLAFFRARVEDEGAAVEAFLDEHPDVRLSHEAAELLLELRLSEAAGEEETRRAVRWIHDTTVPDLRTTRLLDLMGELTDEGQSSLAVAAGELGIESGREDRYPNAVHETHSKLGAILLEDGESRRAWRHLLSAAFGIPEDGMVNLNLGRYYEGEGRHKRAFSRYVQAAIKPESGPQAIAALERVQHELPDEDPFSVDLVERMVEGKVKSFGTATRFQVDEDSFAGRVTLVEFFTSANLGDGSRGAIGGALGNQGLLGHFPPENVAFLSYHLAEPSPDPMVNALAVYTAGQLGVGGPYEHLINGTLREPGAARWRQGEAIYNACRKTIEQQLSTASDYTLTIEDARVAEGEVSGRLVVTGPDATGLRVQVVLAEGGVLFPGKSEVVVHRMVARGSLLGVVQGVAYEPTKDRMEIPFARTLSELTAENEAHLDLLETTGGGSAVRISMRIDPAQVRIVAFLREVSGRVPQALQVRPLGTEDRR